MDRRWLGTLEEHARLTLPTPLFRYLSQGAGEGISAAEAAAGWATYRLLPHVLRDVTRVDTGATLLGARAEVPFGIAPSTLQRAVHPDGELAMARAAATAGSVLVVSSNAGTTFADVGATGVRWWLQLYVPADRALAEPVIDRAVAAGASAIVLTVDTPVVGTKLDGDGPTVWQTTSPDLLRVNLDPGVDGAPGSEKATDLGPHDLVWLSDISGLPLVVKGVLSPQDARRCVHAGASGVWVSNHGGRQLDRVAATATALPEVVAAVGDAADVYVDGGLRSGLDVVTALALGASAVFLGRLPLYALVEGAPGVLRLYEELRGELIEAMRLAGCRDVAELRGIATR